MKRSDLIKGGIAFVVVVIIIVVAVSSRKGKPSSDFASSYFTSCGDRSRESELGSFSAAAVSTDAVPCGEIAIEILKKNGTAADAAIAGMFCVGVINAQSSGLGGGFVATYYSRETMTTYSLDAREVAPGAATPTMYNPETSKFLREEKTKWYEMKPAANIKGGLSVAVPGESAGLYELYVKFGGGVKWADLIEPTIQLCEEGYELTWYTGGIMYPMREDILIEPSMSIFTNTTEKRVLHEGEKVYRKKLAQTLRVLQEEPYALYNGSLAEPFVKDLEAFGGIITLQDMMDYRPIWRQSLQMTLETGNYTLHSFPPPGSGLILGLILNILDKFNLNESNLDSENLYQTHQWVAEAFKFGYAKRFELGDLSDEDSDAVMSRLTSDELVAKIKSKINDNETNQDPEFYGAQMVPGEDLGTAHFSLIAPNGDAISLTSSINYAYGAGIRSETTGIIYNNEMADFTTDESNAKPGSMKMDKNTIRPGKRPLSSMSPSIFTSEDGDVKLVLGGAGGVRIPSAEAWVAIRYLWLGQNLKDAIDSCRSHHQLIPMKLQYENGFPKDILNDLQGRGHKTKEYTWKSVVNAVAKEGETVVANSDYRKSGEIAGF